MLIDVVVDVGEGLFGFRRELGLIDLDGLFAVRLDAEFGCGFGGGWGRCGFAVASGEGDENADGEDGVDPAQKLHPC